MRKFIFRDQKTREKLTVTVPEDRVVMGAVACHRVRNDLPVMIIPTFKFQRSINGFGHCLRQHRCGLHSQRKNVLDGNYGMYVWPCAPVLAQYIWYNRNVIKRKFVLEIGAGTALPGVIAGLCGANVILSDSASLPKCLDNCQQTCKANGLENIPILGITWGCFDPDLLRLRKVDIILGSDCFYDTKDFEDVIVTVSFILERNKDAEFWSTYQERSSERSIEHLLMKWGLHCRQISLSSFDADSPHLAESDLPGNHTIHMLIITKRRQNDKMK